MSKRKPSSPYKNPPSPLVRMLTTGGWRRCDAEGIVAVWQCMYRAKEANRVQLREVGARMAVALEREPVLAGAVLFVAPRPGAADAFARLLGAVGVGRHWGLYRLWRAAVAFELAADDDDYVDFDDEDLDEDLPA